MFSVVSVVKIMAKKSLKISNKTPAEMGYIFPPEWHPHSATWFSWPRPEGISFPGKYHSVPENLAANHSRDSIARGGAYQCAK